MSAQRVTATGMFALVAVFYAVAIVLAVMGDLVPAWELVVFGVWLFAFAVVGLLIVFRRPGNAIAWLCLGFGVVWASYFAADSILSYEMAMPGLVARPDLIGLAANQVWVPGVGLIGFLLLLFPEGHLPSPRWKWLGRLLAVVMTLIVTYGLMIPGEFTDWQFVNPIGVAWLSDYEIISIVLVITLALSIVACAVSVIFRYRRADTTERLQLKWLAAAGAISAISYALVFVDDGGAWILAWSAIPVAIGFSVLRYRLYDIDRLISRTITYAVVAGLLAATFFGAVVLLSMLVPSQSNLAVAGSTLIVAVTFNPLRGRIQGWIDRRFDRSRFDSQRVIEQFSDQVRNQTDIDQLNAELTELVGRTLRPSAVSLWVRPSA